MVILAFFLVKGIVRGLVREVLGLVGLAAAVIISVSAYAPLATFLREASGQDTGWWEPVSFAVLLVAVLLFFFYLSRLLSKLVEIGPLSFLNRLLGAGAGLIKGILVCFLLLNIMLLLTPMGMPAPMQASWLRPRVLQAGDYLLNLVPDELTNELREKARLTHEELTGSARRTSGAEKKED
jgi:membrane protein required for colicin V production